MKNSVHCCAVIAAAGSSSRMGTEISKQFIPLLGVPAIARTLKAFEEAGTVDSMVVVCREADRDRMRSLVESYQFRKVKAVVPGGDTRQKSVQAGVGASPHDAAYFAVHDGARPLVTPAEIDACIMDCRLTRASALGTLLKDTVKIVDSRRMVLITPDRAAMWAVQTPQVFERSVYLQALEQARKEGAEYTDDCQLVEHLGIQVHICEGSYDNIKLTTREDVFAAEAILKRRGRAN